MNQETGVTPQVPSPMISDLYAGYVERIFGQDVRDKLSQCMNQSDPELYQLWGKAVESLAKGDDQAWQKYFAMA